MNTVKMTAAARANVEETGTNPETDVALMRSGEVTPRTLLAECLDGADPDRVEGWHDYVDAIVQAASSTAQPENNWVRPYDPTVAKCAQERARAAAEAALKDRGLDYVDAIVQAASSTAQPEPVVEPEPENENPNSWVRGYVPTAVRMTRERARLSAEAALKDRGR